MLGDILKRIHDAEDEADNILMQAEKETVAMKKDMFTAIEQINHNTDMEIAKTIASLPKPQPTIPQTVDFDINANKIATAVKYATDTFLTEFK